QQAVARAHAATQLVDELGQQLAQVAGEFADTPRLVRVRRVLLQVVPVLPDRHAAAGCVHDDGLDAAALDVRPPGVDVGAHLHTCALLVVEVEADGAAAVRLLRDDGFDVRG